MGGRLTTMETTERTTKMLENQFEESDPET